MKWVWERRWTLIYWGVILYLLALAVALAVGAITDALDPPEPVIVPQAAGRPDS